MYTKKEKKKKKNAVLSRTFISITIVKKSARFESCKSHVYSYKFFIVSSWMVVN